jgi:hypothetical protein
MSTSEVRRRSITISVYRDLREDGAPRWNAVLLATGWWCVWPFRLLFPEVDVRRDV